MSDTEDNARKYLNEEDRAREEEDELWQAFMQFDHEQLGKMATKDLQSAMELLGEKVTPFRSVYMISQADPENTGALQFSQFK